MVTINCLFENELEAPNKQEERNNYIYNDLQVRLILKRRLT